MPNPINAVRTLLVNFARECLAGEVPRTLAFADDYRRVATALTKDPVFFASDVTQWSDSERRALFETLITAIVELREPLLLEPTVVEGSTPRAVRSAFASWLARHAAIENVLPQRAARVLQPAARRYAA